MAGNKTLELSIKIAGKVDKSLIKAINAAQGNISSLSTSLSRVGTVGLAAMGALSTGTVAALAQCTNAAAEFGNQMADVVKYVDGLADANGEVSGQVWGTDSGGNPVTYAENYEKMAGALLDLSTQIPMTAEDLTKLAAAAGQSGKGINDLIQYDEQGNIQGFLRDVAMMGTAMDITADQAGNWAAKWEKAFDIDHTRVMELSDQINYLGANSATTAAEIAEVVNEAAGLGQVAGMAPEATAALADAMLAMGVDTGKAANSISRMYVNLSKGSSATKAQKTQWEALGLTAEGVAKSMQADATGTIIDVFQRIQNLDADKQVAALSTLFGQWAIKGAAKLTGNLDTFTDALAMVNDPSLYNGSMEREFIIKASTSGAIDTMMGNAFQALKVDIGTAFLPAKKEISVALIDFMNELRNMPELGEVARQLATLFSQGVSWAGEALKEALPYVRQFLDYLIHNGPQVVSMLGKLTAAFAAMKFAPAIEGTLKGVGGMIFGSGGGAGAWTGGAGAGTGGGSGLVGMLGSLFKGGQTTADTASAAFQAAKIGAGVANTSVTRYNGEQITHSGASGFLNKLQNSTIGAIFGLKNRAALTDQGRTDRSFMNSLMGTAEKIANAKQNGGLLGMAKNAIGGSGTGQYFSRLGGAAANFGNKSGIVGAAKTSGQVLGSIFGFGGRYSLGGGQAAQPLVNVPGIWQGIRNAGAGAASWIGGKAGAIANSRPVQAVGGFIGNVARSAPVQGIASMAKGAFSWATGTLGSGLQLAGTALGPLISALGSVVAGATPVVLAISTVIAVLSLLWDNVDALREPVGAIFGEKGLAVFDSFKNGLSGVFGFIQGLFDGGLADALSGARDMFGNALDGGGLLSAIFGGTEGGLAAFDGLVTIGQSALGFIGQVVSFANTTVKPMIVEIFSFITQTVMPTLISVFSSSAPTIASILTGVGDIIMTVVQGVMTVIQALWPSIQQIIQVVMDVASLAIPALLNAIDLVLPAIQGIIGMIIPVVTVAVSTVGGLLSGLADSIGEITGGIMVVFNGVIDFITGVFTGNWAQAWEGVRDIFGGVFAALAGLCKTPINAVIGIINGAIRGLNSISCDIPEWVPVVGGQKFGLNMKELPLLAKGGFTTGPSIAGEAGTEAVISFQRSARASNIATWTKAGQMLGVGNNAPARIKDFDDYGGDGGWRPGSDGGTYTVTYAPTIVVQGGGSREDMDAALREDKSRFQRWYEEMRRNERRVRF